MKLAESLNNTFDIETVHPTTTEVITTNGEVIVPHDTKVEQNVDYDYEKTRNNLHSLLQQGQDALYHALEIAKQSEHPRAFEVVGGLMKQLADINGQLLDLTDKRQKLVSKKTDDTKPNVTNNNAIFVGSTSELNKMLKQMNGEN